VSALVVAVAALALIAGGSDHAAGVTTALPASAPEPPFPGVRYDDPPLESGGTIVFGRLMPGVQPFGDTVLSLTAVAPDGRDRHPLLSRPVCCLTWSPAAGRLAIAPHGGAGRRRPASVTPDGSSYLETAAGRPGITLRPGAWSPDGHTLAFDGWAGPGSRANGVYLAPAAGGPLVRITRTPREFRDRPLAWAPGGPAVLVFRRRSPDGSGTLLIVRTGGRARRITPPGMASWCCALGIPGGFLPHGEVAFAAFAPRPGRPLRSAAFLWRPGTQRAERITRWGTGITSARPSPDGSWIAFDRANRLGGWHDLFLVRPDGSGERMLNTASAGIGGSCCSVWAPNGRSLLFQRVLRKDHVTLAIVNADGDPGTRTLTGPNGGYLDYVWTDAQGTR
jgi:Tol biopolymer transport system component